VRRLLVALARPLYAALWATVAGLFCARLFASPAAAVAAGSACVTTVFLAMAWLLDAAGARSLLLSVTHNIRNPVTRKVGHGR
jgi:putative peptidoglycan lipid II flippase